MAAKKKKIKRPAPPKKTRRVARQPKVSQALPIIPPPQKSGIGLGTFTVLAMLAVGLYFVFRSSETPTPTKVAAGVKVTAAPATEGTQVQAPRAEPQKRATSPGGPRVWDRKKNKGPVRFYVVREKDGVAEIMLFKAGNVAVQLISSEKGPRKTVELRWDGKDAKGAVVAPGTYYARISGAHGDMVEEILVK